MCFGGSNSSTTETVTPAPAPAPATPAPRETSIGDARKAQDTAQGDTPTSSPTRVRDAAPKDSSSGLSTGNLM